ncbi:MAG: hypothetical protein RSA87_01540, partial [Malacoplasma sp.]
KIQTIWKLFSKKIRYFKKPNLYISVGYLPYQGGKPLWKIVDDNTIKLVLKKLKNRINKIAYVGDSIKIFIAGNNMELKKSKTSLKDSLINIINQRFDSMTKESNQRLDEKFDLITKEIKEVKKDINNLDTKLNKVIELNNLKV